MIRFILLMIVSVLIGCSTTKPASDRSLDRTYIYPISKNGKWGYSAENGKIEIDYAFEEADFFVNNDWAVVKLNNKYGFINRQGEFIQKPKYDTVIAKRFDRALVRKNRKSFTVTKYGKRTKEQIGSLALCGEPRLCSDPLEYFDYKDKQYILKQEHLAKQQRFDPLANFTAKDFSFEDVLTFTDKSFIVQKDDLYAIFVHFNGVGLKATWFDELIPSFGSRLTPPNGGKYSAQYAMVNKDNRWGLISSMGRIIIEPEFISMQYVNGFFYLVEFEPDHWGYISTNGKRYF